MISAILLDASVAMKLVATEPGSAKALDLFDKTDRVLAPDWMPLEVANALWKRHLRGDASAPEVAMALALLESLEIAEVAARPLVASALQLALDSGHPVYDCLYLVLALDEGVPLATADARLRRTGQAAGVDVIWIDSAP